LDLGIGFGDLPTEDIEITPLHVERMALIVNVKRSPVRKTALSEAEVASIPLALLDASFLTRRIVDRYFRDEGLRPRIAVEANSNLTLFETHPPDRPRDDPSGERRRLRPVRREIKTCVQAQARGAASPLRRLLFGWPDMLRDMVSRRAASPKPFWSALFHR
jgi:hypothetical protein